MYVIGCVDGTWRINRMYVIDEVIRTWLVLRVDSMSWQEDYSTYQWENIWTTWLKGMAERSSSCSKSANDSNFGSRLRAGISGGCCILYRERVGGEEDERNGKERGWEKEKMKGRDRALEMTRQGYEVKKRWDMMSRSMFSWKMSRRDGWEGLRIEMRRDSKRGGGSEGVFEGVYVRGVV